MTTERHTDASPANLNHVQAEAGRRSPRFWKMFVISTALIIAAMIAVFIFAGP